MPVTETALDEHGHPADLPPVGSEWLARDGRLLRVDAWTRPTHYPADDYWADCTVLNRAKGQRARTQMARANFGTFLVPAPAGGSGAEPRHPTAA